jgi:hypothetical protein
MCNSSTGNGYNKAPYFDDRTPSLVPVFDPAFTSPADISPFKSVDQPQFSNDTGGSHGGSDTVEFDEWESWAPPRRIEAIRLWVIDAVNMYGPVEGWGEELPEAKGGDALAVSNWLDSMNRRVSMGRSALRYLERAMEGELSDSVEEWRELYTLSHRLASQLWGGVLGLQYRLNSASSGGYNMQPHLNLH